MAKRIHAERMGFAIGKNPEKTKIRKPNFYDEKLPIDDKFQQIFLDLSAI